MGTEILTFDDTEIEKINFTTIKVLFFFKGCMQILKCSNI